MPSQPTESGRIAAFDGLRLVHRTWHADDPKGAVIVIHGLAEHGLRYGHVIDVLLPAGFSVMTWDLRGHGESGGVRGHVNRFEDFCDDAAMMIAFARDRLTGPLFVLAHSMGGLIATRMAVAGKLNADGLILSNPALANALEVPAWKIMAAKGLSKWLPKLSVPTDIPAEWISQDAEEVRKYADDPHVFTTGTTRWGAEMLAAQEAIATAANRFVTEPTLVQLGTGDKVVDASFCARFFGSSASSDCDIREYSGAFHEVYNELEPIRTQVLADLCTWLAKHAE